MNPGGAAVGAARHGRGRCRHRRLGREVPGKSLAAGYRDPDCRAWNSLFTTCDPAWTSLIATPPHPDYIAGHPAFSERGRHGACRLFGTDNIAFCSTSDPYINGSQGPVGPLTECFNNFSEAAMGPSGAAFSRITGGIHTPFAVQDGLQLGALIGTEVFADNLRPVPEPATVLLLSTCLGILPLLRQWQPHLSVIMPMRWASPVNQSQHTCAPLPAVTAVALPRPSFHRAIRPASPSARAARGAL